VLWTTLYFYSLQKIKRGWFSQTFIGEDTPAVKQLNVFLRMQTAPLEAQKYLDAEHKACMARVSTLKEQEHDRLEKQHGVNAEIERNGKRSRFQKGTGEYTEGRKECGGLEAGSEHQ
jgi:hypothetical protein